MAYTYKYFPLALPIIFNDIVSIVGTNSAKNVNFMHGTWHTLMNRLIEKKKSTQAIKNNMYPLIALIHDFEIKNNGNEYTTSLDFVIVTPTTPQMTPDDRYTKNYLPILYPIYAEFMQVVYDSPYFIGSNETSQYKHNRIDDLHMGVTDANGKVAYQLPDFLDGIIVKNLELNLDYNYCNSQTRLLIQ